jgi:peroxiredoxin Q/BCP
MTRIVSRRDAASGPSDASAVPATSVGLRLRVLRTSLLAIGSGLAYALTGRGGRRPVRLEPGDMAPDFELPGSDGRTYRLLDFRGAEAVVLAWFPKAFTSGCTAECRSLADSMDAVDAFQARCFGVSVDRPDASRQFAEAMRLPFPVLSDPSRAVARAYGVLGASGFASRWTFYIGADGRVLDVDRSVDAASHGRRVVSRLRELRIPMRRPRSSGVRQ